MSFANPEAFLLFIPLLLVAWYYFKISPRHRSRLIFPTSHWADQRPRGVWPTPFKLQGWLRLVILGLMIVALARPQHVFQQERRRVEAVDMIIVFDLSRSMDAIDFKPNRRTVALNTVADFIDSRKDDRIGLVLFSGEAFLAVPLTTDHGFLKKALMESTNEYLQDGTAIGQAVAVGVYHLRNSNAKSRVIVLVTDGDNNMGSVDPMTATELARSYDLKIYTVAIGSKGRVAYPVKTRDFMGREVQVMQYLTDAINEELLQKMAQMTGGRFFRATENDVLTQIFETIDKLEKTKVETTTLVRKTEKVWPWLWLIVVLLVLEIVLLNTRWRKIP